MTDYNRQQKNWPVQFKDLVEKINMSKPKITAETPKSYIGVRVNISDAYKINMALYFITSFYY